MRIMLYVPIGVPLTYLIVTRQNGKIYTTSILQCYVQTTDAGTYYDSRIMFELGHRCYFLHYVHNITLTRSLIEGISS